MMLPDLAPPESPTCPSLPPPHVCCSPPHCRACLSPQSPSPGIIPTRPMGGGHVMPPSAACLKAGWLHPAVGWAPAHDSLGLESLLESLVFLVAHSPSGQLRTCGLPAWPLSPAKASPCWAGTRRLRRAGRVCWAWLERGPDVGLQGARIRVSSTVCLPFPHGGLEAGVGRGPAAQSESLGRTPGHVPHHRVRAAPGAQAWLRTQSPKDQTLVTDSRTTSPLFPDCVHDADALPHPATAHCHHDAARLALHVLRDAGILRPGARAAPGHMAQVSHWRAGALTAGSQSPFLLPTASSVQDAASRVAPPSLGVAGSIPWRTPAPVLL